MGAYDASESATAAEGVQYVDVGINVSVLVQMHNGTLAFVKRYRPVVDDVLLELPSMSLKDFEQTSAAAGGKQPLTNEQQPHQQQHSSYGPKDVAMFIARDQLGVVIEESDIVPMFEYWMSPGTSNERSLVYYASKSIDVTEDIDTHIGRVQKERGVTSIEYMAQGKLRDHLMEAYFRDAKTTTAVAQYLLSTGEQALENKLLMRKHRMLYSGMLIGILLGVITAAAVAQHQGERSSDRRKSGKPGAGDEDDDDDSVAQMKRDSR